MDKSKVLKQLKLVPTQEKQQEWDQKETTTGSQSKADKALQDAKSYADQNKVAKVEGKQLSTEDYTKEDKAKLASLEKLKPATAQALGGVKVGAGLAVQADGTLSADVKEISWDGISGKPEQFKPESHQHTKSEITDMFNVVNELNSDSTTDALSAAQGKTLNDKINNINTNKNIFEKNDEAIKIQPATANNAAFISLYKDKTNRTAYIGHDSASTNDITISSDVNNGNIILKTKGNGKVKINNKEVSTFSGKYQDLTGIPSEFTPATHTHTKSEITDMFEVEDALTTDSTTNALSVHQGKLIDDKVNTLRSEYDETKSKVEQIEGANHSHTNKLELDKITDGKVADWDAKETTAGSQEKATKALTDAKAYSDEKIKELVGSAPETLDTIYEISAALQQNQGAVEAMTSQIAGKAEKTHQHTKADITDMFSVVNALNSTSQTDALSAAQGKALKELIDAKQTHTHANRPALDSITSEKITEWNKALKFNKDLTIADANAFKSTGLAKTGTTTKNLPASCNAEADKWGIIQFVAENEGVGTQVFYPIDGKFKGTLFVRASSKGTWSDWKTFFSGNYNDLTNKPELNFAPKTHTHTKDQITDLFSVENSLTSTSIENALSAAQGKVLNDKITPLEEAKHTHDNKDELAKITVGKVDEWNAKESTTGSQEKANVAKQEANKYTDEKFNALMANPSKQFSVTEFTLDELTQLQKATVKHDLNTQNVLVSVLNNATKESELVSFKAIDANNIEIYAEDTEALEVLIIGEGTKIVTLQSGAIVDTATAKESTWSSSKIEQELNALKERLTKLESAGQK